MLQGLLGKAILGPLLPIIDKVIDRLIPDKAKAAEVKLQLQGEMMRAEADLAQAAASVVVAEATGHSWMQRNWRPLLMFLMMGMLVWFIVVIPLLSAIFGLGVLTVTRDAINSVPQGVWTLLSIGVGGYIGGRSIEKVAASWKAGQSTPWSTHIEGPPEDGGR